MIRRRLWIYRRLLRNWYRTRYGSDATAAQLEGLTDPGLLDRITA